MKFIPLMVYLSFIPFKAFSECNYKEDIKKNQDGSYTYTRDCHILVGKSLDELDIRKEQLENAQRIVTLKDLAIQDYERNVNLWKNTSVDLNDRLSKIDSSRNTDKTLYFVMGAATVILSVFAASKAMK